MLTTLGTVLSFYHVAAAQATVEVQLEQQQQQQQGNTTSIVIQVYFIP